MMRRLAMAAAAALIVAAWATPRVVREWRDARAWERVRAGGVLRVGVDPSAMPYSFYGAHGWDGYEADMARALAAELGLTLAVTPVGYDGRFDALRVGQVDVFISASTPEGGRPQFAWSRVYLDVGPRLLVRRDSTVQTAHDLVGARVAMARGGAADRSARHWQRRVAAVTRDIVVDDAAAMRAVLGGEAVAAFVSGEHALRAACPPHGSGPAGDDGALRCIAVAPEPYAVLMRADDVQLRRAVDAALQRIDREGAPRTWQRRWFSVTVQN